MKRVHHITPRFVIFLISLGILTEKGSCDEGQLAWLPKPFVIVEASFDRENSSDIYAFDFEGTLLRRLTREPLPSCNLTGVSADGKTIAFTANAMAFYSMSTRNDRFTPLHAGNVETVAMAPGGKFVAYVAKGFERGAGAFLYIHPLLVGSPFKRMKIPLPETAMELAFAPDGQQVLLTTWSGWRATIHRCDLTSRKIEPWMTDPNASYYQPTFASNRESVAVVSENLKNGDKSILSKAWPTGDVKILYSKPGESIITDTVFTSDGKHLLFRQDGVLARIPAEGGEAQGVSKVLDRTPRPSTPSRLLDGSLPIRNASTPRMVDRWLASFNGKAPNRELVIIDLQTNEQKIVPLPTGSVFKAVIVE